MCFSTDRCYWTYICVKPNSLLLAKLCPSLARGWGKHLSSKSHHIIHLFRHNNCGKYITKTFGNWGRDNLPSSSPVLPHHFIAPPPGTAHVAREGSMCAPTVGGRRVGGTGSGNWCNKLWGMLLFQWTGEIVRLLLLLLPHFCTKSPPLTFLLRGFVCHRREGRLGKGGKGKTSLQHTG